MSLRSLAIVKDLKLLKVFFERSKRYSPMLYTAIRALKSQAFLKNQSRLLLHGFRISKLNASVCEIVIPKNWINENDSQCIEDSTLVSGAHFGADVYWDYINPEPRLWFAQLQSSHVEILTPFSEDLKQIRLKIGLDFQERENLFFMMREKQESRLTLIFDGMNLDEQLICQIELKYKVISRPQKLISGSQK
jgi:hypothetical protein